MGYVKKNETMNWIIRSTKKLEFHTNLNILLRPIYEDLKDCNWVLSDLDFIEHEQIPINLEEELYILNPVDFKRIFDAKVQIIWGVISAVPKSLIIELDQKLLPYVDGNDNIWSNGNMQVKNSIMEIIAYDSSFTIAKFADSRLSNKFKEYFSEAIELSMFK